MFNGNTPISTYFHLRLFLPFEVATTWQIDSTAYKLKPRLFSKSVYLQANLADFYPNVNHA